MRWAACLLLLIGAGASAADHTAPRVQVAQAYLELHTGPGRGYPVFYVVDRGGSVALLKRRTGWYKVEAAGGQRGWVSGDELSHTLQPSGETVDVPTAQLGDFSARRVEMGVLGGDFGGADLIGIYGAYAFTANVSAEFSATQVLGAYSDGWLLSADLVHQPFPEWRVSPFLTLGGGIIRTNPRATLVQTRDRNDQEVHAGAGLRAWLTRRLILRLEYKSYVVLTSRDDNEEIEAWKAGFSFFF